MYVNIAAIGRSCAKVFLLFLNGGCILVAFCTLVFAVFDTGILKQYGEDHATGTIIGDIVVIVVCLLLIVVAVVGSVGAVKENFKILYLYIGFLMIMVILELLIAVYVAVQRYGLEFKVSEWLREDFFRNITDGHDETHQKLWDDLQITYECCGLNGPEDYMAIQKPISMSCCPRAYRAKVAYAKHRLYRACIQSRTYRTEGCEDEILYVLRSDADWLIGAAVSCFWFQCMGMLFAMWVVNNSKKEDQQCKNSVRY